MVFTVKRSTIQLVTTVFSYSARSFTKCFEIMSAGESWLDFKLLTESLLQNTEGVGFERSWQLRDRGSLMKHAFELHYSKHRIQGFWNFTHWFSNHFNHKTLNTVCCNFLVLFLISCVILCDILNWTTIFEVEKIQWQPYKSLICLIKAFACIV